jgi:hypothetical protein
LIPGRRWLFWAGIVLAALVCGVVSRRVTHSTFAHSPRLAKTVATAATPRKVYRYSVVPGGVYSDGELATARRVDPIVAAHYADFGTRVSVTRLNRDMFVYVSYRKANRVFWSTKKHRVCEGETVITDGKNMARGRCGNRLSFTPFHPVLDLQEPHEKELDTQEPLIASLPECPLFSPSFPGLKIPEQIPGGGSPDVAPLVAPSPARTGAANAFPAASTTVPALVPVSTGLPLFAPSPAGPGGTTPIGGAPPPGGGINTPVTPGTSDIPEPGTVFFFLISAPAAGFLWRARQRHGAHRRLRS